MAGLLLVLQLAAAQPALAATIADGNVAVRAGDPETALAIFESVRKTDGDSALLAFNRGVAEYRLGRYATAEVSFARASQDRRLAARAFYNLGLVHRAQDQRDDARVWFQQAAAHPSATRTLRGLARKAERSLGARRVRITRVPSEFGRDPERAIDFFDFGITTGVATDSNVYRSPNDPYRDLAQPGAPLVTPDAESGTFVPIEAWAGAEWGRHPYSRFHLGYRFDGEFYTDSAYRNANRYTHRVDLANTYDRRTRIGRIYVGSSFTAARFAEEAFDRDDGSSQTVLGEDVSDRLSFSQFSPRVRFAHDIGDFRYGFKAVAALNEYDETQPAVDYSHYQLTGGADISYRLSGMTRIGLNSEYALRDYDSYPARELDGSRFTLAPTLEYKYWSVGALLRQRVTDALWAGVDYQITEREDQYLGYDDYRRNTIRLRANLALRRLEVTASYVYRDYEFDNAFAFDTPAGGEKTLTSTAAEVDIDFRIWRALSLTAFGRLNLIESSDARLEYDRNQFALGVRWTL